MPQVSVLMGIYNCAETLPAAIDCILKQSFTDWELIMCDDGSTDGTYAVAEKYAEKYPDKIRLVKNEKNLGLNRTLNNCAALAQGEYLARMDGDDLCTPDRFEKELAVLNEEKNLSFVTSAMTLFDDKGEWGLMVLPEYPEKKFFLKTSPFCHASCIIKKSAFDSVGGYGEGKHLLRVEDYHLWVKLYSAGFVGKNLSDPLYSMRDDRASFSRRKFRYRFNEAYVICLCVKSFKLPFYYCYRALRPILVGLLPTPVYKLLHKRNLKG